MQVPKGIAGKLNEIKDAVKYLQKDGASGGGSFSYAYVTPENVLDTFNPLLIEKGLNIVPEIVKVTTLTVPNVVKDGAERGLKIVYIVDMEITVTDVQSGESMMVKWVGTGENDTEKGFGSALTYGLRYWFLHTFQIPTGKDDPDAKRREEDDKKKNELSIKEAQAAKVKAIGEMKARIAKCSTVDELNIIGKDFAPFDKMWRLTDTEAAELKLAGSTRKLEIAKLIDPQGGTDGAK